MNELDSNREPVAPFRNTRLPVTSHLSYGPGDIGPEKLPTPRVPSRKYLLVEFSVCTVQVQLLAETLHGLTGRDVSTHKPFSPKPNDIMISSC